MVLALCLLAGSVRSAEPLEWHADVTTAAKKARHECRLLFILHLSGDFTSRSTEIRPFVVYRTLALLDEKVQEALADKYVLAYQHVGRPAILGPEDAPQAKQGPRGPSDEFAIAYVCLPDCRVIHWIPGFVTSGELLAELEFAAECHADLARFPEAEQAGALHQTQLEKVSERTRQRFEKAIAVLTRKDAVKSASKRSIDLTVRAVRGVFEQRLTERFGPMWTPAEFSAVATALAAQHGSGDDEAHLLLAEHPLAPLEELAGPAYTHWSGHRFWQSGSRDDEVASWIAEHAGKGRPLLLAIDAEGGDFPGKERKDPLAWPIPESFPLPYREDFHVLKLSPDELAVWLQARELGSIKLPVGQMVRFVLFDRRGEFVAAVGQREGRTRLATVMRSAGHIEETGVSKERADK